MLTEDMAASFGTEEEQATQQAFIRQVTNNSLIHKSTLFKDTSCQIVNSVISKNVQIGSNCKISGCVILSNSVIGDNATVENTFVNFKAHIQSGSTHANPEILGAKKAHATNDDGVLSTLPDEEVKT